MGVFDNIKDSISGSGSSSNSGSDLAGSSDFGGSDSFNDSQFNDSFETGPGQENSRQPAQGPGQGSQNNLGQPDNPVDNSRSGQSPPGNGQPAPGNNRGNQGTQPNNRQSGTGGQHSARQQGRNIRNQEHNLRQPGQQSSSPNAQAGRPEEGSSEPQLSSQTRRKLDNAGFSGDRAQQGSGQGQAGNMGQQQGRDAPSVADSRDELEQIKSQNQQIIELLKRINESLNGSRR